MKIHDHKYLLFVSDELRSQLQIEGEALRSSQLECKKLYDEQEELTAKYEVLKVVFMNTDTVTLTHHAVL